MIGRREFQGWWWPTDDPENRLPGTLTITDGNVELDLIGNFGEVVVEETETYRATLPHRVLEPKRITGHTTDGNDITLEGPCLGDPGSVTHYRFPWAVVGKTFGASDEIAFDEIAVEISDLDTWTGVSGMSRKPADPSKPDGGQSEMWSVKFDPPPVIEIPLDNGESVALHFPVGHHSWRPVTTKLTIEQRAVLTLRFAKRHNLHEVAERVGELRKFLCFAVGRPVAVTSVVGYQDDCQRERINLRREIELLWEIPHNPKPPDEPKLPQRMLFTLDSAPSGISETLKRWFAIQERYHPVLSLFFGMQFHPDMYGDLRFLAYAQAIETYHLRHTGKKNRKLELRIKDILSLCPPVTENVLAAASQTSDAFVEAFLVSRNYYTHYDWKNEEGAARGIPLAALSYQLQALIEMALLREIGFSCEEIDYILTTRARRYAAIRNAVEQIDEEEVVAPQLAADQPDEITPPVEPDSADPPTL